MNNSPKVGDLMLHPIFCTPEDYVDFDIKIGLLLKNDRQSVIDNLYESTSKILSEMLNDANQSICI